MELIMTLILIDGKQRLAAIVALQANLENQRLNSRADGAPSPTPARTIPPRARATSSAVGAWRAAKPIASFREARKIF
jgi:hypothetical protein